MHLQFCKLLWMKVSLNRCHLVFFIHFYNHKIHIDTIYLIVQNSVPSLRRGLFSCLKLYTCLFLFRVIQVVYPIIIWVRGNKLDKRSPLHCRAVEKTFTFPLHLTCVTLDCEKKSNSEDTNCTQRSLGPRFDL